MYLLQVGVVVWTKYQGSFSAWDLNPTQIQIYVVGNLLHVTLMVSMGQSRQLRDGMKFDLKNVCIVA